MKIVEIKTNKLENGMIVAEAIFNRYGAVILDVDYVLRDEDIYAIESNGHLAIKIYVEETIEEKLLEEKLIKEKMIKEKMMKEELINEKIMNEKVLQVKHIKFKDSGNKKTKIQEEFEEEYNKSMSNVIKFIDDIQNGETIKLENINTTVTGIYQNVNKKLDIGTWLISIKDSDDYLYYHSMDVSMFAMLMGKWLDYSEEKQKEVATAGLLHDIGKTKVDPLIIGKRGPLTQFEMYKAKKHSEYGYSLIEYIADISDDVKKSVLMHHERNDGTGYPSGLIENQINEYAKIISIADTFSSMTSERVFKKKQTPFQVFELFQKNAFGNLDFKCKQVFLKNIYFYYIGKTVRLNTGDEGEIVFFNPSDLSKPMIKIGDIFIDLAIEKKYEIIDVL